jgi:hypothetical protein
MGEKTGLMGEKTVFQTSILTYSVFCLLSEQRS